MLGALKKDGVWSLTSLKLSIDGRDDVIDLLKDSRAEMETPSALSLTRQQC